MWYSSSPVESMESKIFLQKVFQRKSLAWVLFLQVILYPPIAEADKTAELADTSHRVLSGFSWSQPVHHHWMYPLNTEHAQSVASPV